MKCEEYLEKIKELYEEYILKNYKIFEGLMQNYNSSNGIDTRGLEIIEKFKDEVKKLDNNIFFWGREIKLATFDKEGFRTDKLIGYFNYHEGLYFGASASLCNNRGYEIARSFNFEGDN